MIFTPLIEEEEIEKAYRSFCNSMTKDIPKFPSYLSYRRYAEPEEKRDVCWNELLGIWSFFHPAEKLYWCPFGVQDSSTSAKTPRLSMTCAINFPREGINRRVNGLFVRDEEGIIYVTHKGNFGGGAKGISGSSFKKSNQYDLYKNNVICVTWQDGKETETICIGRLKDSELPYKVANFVKNVECFKDNIYRMRRTPGKEVK